MIWEIGLAIVTFLLVSVILAGILILPDATLSANVTDAITTAGGYLQGLDDFIPIGTILLIVLSIVLFESYYFLYKTLMWAVKLIRGSG